MALIADVATDAVSGRVLEVGTGVPQRMVVVCKDAYGGTRLTVGYVYFLVRVLLRQEMDGYGMEGSCLWPEGKRKSRLGNPTTCLV